MGTAFPRVPLEMTPALGKRVPSPLVISADDLAGGLDYFEIRTPNGGPAPVFSSFTLQRRLKPPRSSRIDARSSSNRRRAWLVDDGCHWPTQDCSRGHAGNWLSGKPGRRPRPRPVVYLALDDDRRASRASKKKELLDRAVLFLYDAGLGTLAGRGRRRDLKSGVAGTLRRFIYTP